MKSCVHTALFIILLVNVIYFCYYYVIPFSKDYYDLNISYQKLEPLTIRGNPGRLGNQMFVFATLYGLAKLNAREIALMPKNYEILSEYFDLNFPKINAREFRVRDPWMIRYWLSPEDASIPLTSNIITGNMYPTSFTFFEHVKDDIRRIFQFKKHIREHAEEVFRHVKKVRPWTQVFVCVHVRRGDYLRKSNGGWLRAADGREVDKTYFEKSIEYFRSKYKNITFLAVSDDRRWTKENLSPLGILTLPESGGPGHDLAVLSYCNHTIMTYGSYGFWGSYLAGGDVVYFTDFLNPNSKMAKIFLYEKMYPKEWIGISTTPPGFWENYTNPFMT